MDWKAKVEAALSGFGSSYHLNVADDEGAGAKVFGTKCPDCGAEWNCYFELPLNKSMYSPCGHSHSGPPMKAT